MTKYLLLFITTMAFAQERDSSSVSDVLQTLLGQNAPKVGMLAQVVGELYDNRNQTVSDFNIHLLRLYLSGSVDEKFSYFFHGDLNNGYRTLDLKLSYQMSDHFAFDAGQFKAPFGKEWLTHDAQILFLDRSLISQKLNPQRQRGIQIRGSFFEKRFSVTGGAFNGNGQAIDNKISLFVARIAGVPIRTTNEGTDLQLQLSGGVGYSNDPNDLLWIGDHLDHDLLFSGNVKLLYGNFWVEAEDAAAVYSGENVHGYYIDVAGRVSHDVEIALRADYLNYFSQNSVPATTYFPIAYQKKYWIGVNWYAAKGVKLYVDYQRDETFNTHWGFLNLQYGINLDN